MEDKFENRALQWLGFLFFGSLFFLAWHFYRERMLCFDSANYCMYIVNHETYFAGGRWGAAIAQYLPLLALKNGCTLEYFLRSYSVSFILIQYLVFLICTIILKNKKAGLILMLTLCLGFRWMFYYAVSELFMGMAFCILFYALLSPQNSYSNNLKKWIAVLISLFIVYVISYLHQLALLPVLFVLVFELIKKERRQDWSLWAVFFVSLIWILIRIFFLSHDEYDQGKILSLNTYCEQLPKIFSFTSWWYFKTYFKDQLSSLCLLGLLCICILWMRRKWLLLVYLLIFTSFYIALVVLSTYKGDSTLVYQHYYPPIGLLVAVTFINLIYDQWAKRMTYFSVAILLVMNIYGIFQAHSIPTERINYLQRLTDYGHHLKSNKFLLDNKNIPTEITSVQWALPYETLLYSSIISPDSTVSFGYYYESNQFDDLMNNENSLIGPIWSPSDYTTHNLNHRYFHLPNSGYKKVNSSQANPNFNQSVFNNKNVSLEFMKNYLNASKRERIFVPIKILNSSGSPIFSTPDASHPIFLSYHIYDELGRIIRWDNPRTKLEVNINDNYNQVLFVEAPNRKRTYIIEADFLTEGVRWWGCTARIKLVVY